MKLRDVKIFLDGKEANLVEISTRKVRHKTPEEEKKYSERRAKALRYLGEIQIARIFLEECNYQAKMVTESYIELLEKRGKIETLYDGEFVKLCQVKDTKYLLLITKSVADISNFK